MVWYWVSKGCRVYGGLVLCLSGTVPIVDCRVYGGLVIFRRTTCVVLGLWGTL